MVVYDEALIEEFEAQGLEVLRELGVAEISGCQIEARYNSALWIALKYGLTYDYDGSTVTLHRPD